MCLCVFVCVHVCACVCVHSSQERTEQCQRKERCMLAYEQAENEDQSRAAFAGGRGMWVRASSFDFAAHAEIPHLQFVLVTGFSW